MPTFVNRVLRVALFLGLIAGAISKASAQVAFPPGVDWSNATPDQISQAVFDAVKSNPDNVLSIVKSSMQSVMDTGRYPQGFTGGKQDDDPTRPPTLEDMAGRVAESATRANPNAAAEIASAVAEMVPTAALQVAEAVAAVAPQAASDIAQAVLEAVPSLDPVLVEQTVNEGANSGENGGGGAGGSGGGPAPLPIPGGGGSGGGVTRPGDS